MDKNVKCNFNSVKKKTKQNKTNKQMSKTKQNKNNFS